MDSDFLVPYGKPQGRPWEIWFEIGLLGIIASVSEIRADGFDEFYIFDEAPDPARFSELNDDQLGLTLKNLEDEKEESLFWKRILQI